MKLLQNFGYTFRKYLRENMKSLLIKSAGLLAILCIVALWIGYLYNTDERYEAYDCAHGNELIFFTIILMFVALASASGSMSIMSTKEDRVSTLMVPSTMLSKFITVWIVNVPLAVAVFIAFAFVADLVRFLVYAPFVSVTGARVEIFSLSEIGHDSANVFFIILVIGQAVFMLGSTIWNKRAFLMTIVALVLTGAVCVLLARLGFSLTVADSPYYYTDGPNIEPQWWMAWVPACIVSLGLYVLTYFRFKESEIINRW
ncbi:MAG: hypothetical protein NC127_03755 [Muribaculum sp.]|nr:hypothetical protein [Muribaculum sp.]